MNKEIERKNREIRTSSRCNMDRVLSSSIQPNDLAEVGRFIEGWMFGQEIFQSGVNERRELLEEQVIRESRHKLVEVSSNVDEFVKSGLHRSRRIELADRVKVFECRAHEFDVMLERGFRRHCVDRDDVERGWTHEMRTTWQD